MALGTESATACPDYSPTTNSCNHITCRYCTIGHGDTHVDPFTRECEACTTYFSSTARLRETINTNAYILSFYWEGDRRGEPYEDDESASKLQAYMSAYMSEELHEYRARTLFDTILNGPYSNHVNQ